jgi:hypothetical protein
LFATDDTLQLSPVTGLPKTTLIAVQPALAETVTSAGQVIVGAWVSVTVTLCEQVAVFPLVSTAVQITVVTPLLNCADALLLTVCIPQLSLVLGVPSATPVA